MPESTALARRPEAIRAEIAADPERRELLRAATAEPVSYTHLPGAPGVGVWSIILAGGGGVRLVG